MPTRREHFLDTLDEILGTTQTKGTGGGASHRTGVAENRLQVRISRRVLANELADPSFCDTPRGVFMKDYFAYISSTSLRVLKRETLGA